MEKEAESQAAEAFRRIGLPLAEAHAADLASRLKDHDIRIYCPVMDTLGDLGDIAAPYTALLRARLEVPDWKVRVSAARALGKLGEAALASAQLLVLRLEEDPHLEVKLCAVQALGELGGASLHAASQIASMHANCLASHMIMDEAPKLRRACARTLGCLGTYASTCLHELVLALADSDLEVRRQAVSALTGLGESAAPEVVAIIRSAEDIVVTDSTTALSQLAECFSAMGSKLSACPIMEHMYDSEDFDSNYEVDESYTIGTGKFAVVHMCHRRSQPERKYALKVINTRVGDMASLNRIHEEIDILQVLGTHPGLVSIIDVDENMPGAIRLVLELCEGGELYDRIQQKGYYPEQEAKAAVRCLLEAVAYIHSHGIMHRQKRRMKNHGEPFLI
eukprot:g9740.t1